MILACLLLAPLLNASGAMLSPEPDRLKAHVAKLAGIQPPRSVEHPLSLRAAADYIFEELRKAGASPQRLPFKIGKSEYQNISALFGPEKGKRIVIGAHYDVAGDQSGADDNASGVAGLIELARLLAPKRDQLTQPVELVAYSLEEPPHFGGSTMGSAFHARMLREKKIDVEFMASLEMIGYFKDEKGSQDYPISMLKLLYPNVGNYIAIAGRLEERSLIGRMKKAFQAGTDLPIETLAAPRGVPGVDLSDHISYWEQGMKGVIVTDTAFMRNPNYHRESDRPETLDYSRMAKVVRGMLQVILDFALH